MQTLWARAAQVRSTCRCSLCASPANTLARKVTGIPVKRGIRQGDIFLVFSSTAAFEAAVIDSVQKDARSKQWDKVIVEGKEQIEAVEADHEKRIKALLDSAEGRLVRDRGEHQDIGKECNPSYCFTDSRLEWSWQGVFSWATRNDELRRATGFEDWKGPPLSLLKSLKATELRELLSDKRILRHFYGGPDCANLAPDPPKPTISTQKLRTLEWSMAKLVLKILWAVCGQDCYRLLPRIPTDRLAHVIPLDDVLSSYNAWDTKLMQANRKLEELFAHPSGSDIYEYIERPNLPRYDAQITTYEDGWIHLNTALHKTLQKMKHKKKLDSPIAKICQDLLLCRTPPNIHTFNLLLVRFCQLEELSLVHFVLESMWESHIRPNEITHATILRFFTVTGNKKEFALYVKRMRGLKQGLALADPAKPLSPLVKNRVHIFGKNLHKIAVKARMNQEVYSALIVGLLRFFDSEDAMYWYRAMIDQGWRPTVETLTAILQKSCQQNDWSTGMATWQQYTKEALKATAVAYEWMLRLCQRCRHHHVYSEILSDGIREGTLPAKVLAFACEFKTRDIGAILAQAKSEVVAERDEKIVDVTVRKRIRLLRKFEVTEDRIHLLDNALLGSASSKVDLNANIRRLARDVRTLNALRLSATQYEKALSKLSAAIAVTIDEVNSQLPMVKISKSVLKVGLSGDLVNIPLESSPTTLQDSYEHYRKTLVSKLERTSQISTSPSLGGNQAILASWEPRSPLKKLTPIPRQSKEFREFPTPTKWSPSPLVELLDSKDNRTGQAEARAW